MFEPFITVYKSAPWFYTGFAFLFGAIIGSFLNVCIYRIPAGKSVVTPGSHCSCGKPIAWFDNIPIISWFLLKGRARCCGARFSFRYPFVEMLTGSLFMLCWIEFPPLKALCGMVLISCLVCATFIDLDHMIIPDAFTIWLAVTGVVLSALIPSLHVNESGIFIIDSVRSVLESVVGALVGSGLVLWIALLAEAVLKKEAMGFGDVKFVGAIGTFTGWHGTISSIFGGAIVGTLWFIIALICAKVFAQKKTILKSETPEGQATELEFGAQVPFGPMLAIAALIHFLWLHTYVDAYFNELSGLFTRVP